MIPRNQLIARLAAAAVEQFGYADQCIHAPKAKADFLALAETLAEAGRVISAGALDWKNPADALPAVYADVFLAVRGEGLASEGWRHEDGRWELSTGHTLDADQVYAWADPLPAPGCPPITAPLALKGGAA